MRRFFATAALLAAFAAGWLPTPQAVASGAQSDVVLVLAPYLRFSDLSSARTPEMWGLAREGAVGAVNSRARERKADSFGSPAEGALTISSGVWTIPAPAAPAAYSADEMYGGAAAVSAYQRLTGERSAGAAVVCLGASQVALANATEGYRAIPGVLGSAITSAGGMTAALGNSDIGRDGSEDAPLRPAALAAMDREGRVLAGDVSAALTTASASAPFGIESDLGALESQLASVSVAMDVRRGPGLLVVDPGDTYRAARFRNQVSAERAASQRVAAVARLDSVVGMVHRTLPRATVLVVGLSTADGTDDGPESFSPIIASGEGWDVGMLTSDSTHRSGLTNILDVTATVLEAAGVERPVEVLGNPMRSSAGPASVEARIEYLSRMSETAVAVDSTKWWVANTFVIFTVLILLISAVVLACAGGMGARTFSRWTALVKAALLLVACAPLAGWAMFVVFRWPRTGAQAIASYLGCLVVLWAGSLVLAARTPSRVPLAVIALATTLAIMLDQWLSAPLSFTHYFGYSPIVAARFYGIGNEAASILFGAAVVGAALVFDAWPQAQRAQIAKRWGIPVLGALVVLTAAAPFFGANVGVAVWGIIGFGTAYLLMNGHRVTLKTVVLLVLAVVATIGAFAAVDILGGGSQTHLARALGSAVQGGSGELWTIVARKAATNLRVLTATNWAYILLAVLAFLAFARWRPQGQFAETLEANPDFAHAITASLVAGTVAYFSEDSGIVIPALIIFWVGVAIPWLMLDVANGPGRGGR